MPDQEDHIPTETIAVPAQDPEQDEKKRLEPKHVQEKELSDGKAAKEDEIVGRRGGVCRGVAWLTFILVGGRSAVEE